MENQRANQILTDFIDEKMQSVMIPAVITVVIITVILIVWFSIKQKG